MATLASLCARGFGSEVNTGSGSTAHASLSGLFDGELLCDGGEEFLDVLGGLCRSLEEEKASFLSVCFGIGGGDGALVGLFGDKIELVAGEGDDDVFVGLALEFLYPGLCLVKRCLCCVRSVTSGGWLLESYSLSNVVDDDGAVGVAVVHGGKRLVALLACSIPNLKLDGGGVIEGDCLGQEGGADGRFPVVVELVLDETEDERTLLLSVAWNRQSGQGKAHLSDGGFACTEPWSACDCVDGGQDRQHTYPTGPA